MPSQSINERPPGRLLLSVAVISAAALGFEVSLTRLFSVLLRYHFAFLVISIALCGLGVGGYLAQYMRRHREVSLPNSAMGFAIGTVFALIAILHGVFRFFPEAYWLAAVIVLLPFSFAGIFLAEAFSRHSDWSGRLYAWDLSGAALAAIGTVGLLQVFGAINACLVIAALGALAGMLAASSEESKRSPIIGILPIVLLLLPLTNGHGRWLDIPPVPPKPDASGRHPRRSRHHPAALHGVGYARPYLANCGDPLERLRSHRRRAGPSRRR